MIREVRSRRNRPEGVPITVKKTEPAERRSDFRVKKVIFPTNSASLSGVGWFLQMADEWQEEKCVREMDDVHAVPEK